MGRVLHHLITETQDLGLRICHNLDAASTSDIATAYLTRDGLARFEEALSGHLEKGGRSCILVGLWDFITDPRALKALLKLQERYPRTPRRGLEVRLAAGFGFHWKLALFGSVTSPVVIVGSSNLTGKGTSSEGEVNLEIRGSQSLHEELRRRFLEEFDRGRPLDEALLSEYERDYKRFAALRRRMANLRKSGAERYKASARRPSTEIFEPGIFPMTSIGYYEDDAKLHRAADRHERDELSDTRGAGWISNFSPREARRFSENRCFVLHDGLSHRIGIAVCLGKDQFLNSKEKRIWVIFYRWRRGLSRSFRTEGDLKSFLHRRVPRLGTSRSSVGKGLSARLLKAIDLPRRR